MILKQAWLRIQIDSERNRSAGRIDAISGFLSQWPRARIVVLMTSADDVQVLRALKASAQRAPGRHPAVHAGQKRIPPDGAADPAEDATEDELSPREIDVLQMIATWNANMLSR